MSKHQRFIGLDVGAARIGVATAAMPVPIAVQYGFIPVDGTEINAIEKLISEHSADCIVIGYPRNQSGEPTAQTEFVTSFSATLKKFPVEIEFQDESLTSVIAERRLNERGKPYEKGDIDAEAATIILQDFLDLQ